MQAFSVSECWYVFALLAILCYLIGCISFATIIAKFKHADVRQIGSGNPGTMNMSRSFGIKIGALTLGLDLLKGGLPAMISYYVFRNYYVDIANGVYIQLSDITRYWCALFVIFGHIFPITMRFKGGKGIASTLGAFLFSISCENWLLFPFLILGVGLVVIGYIALTEWGSAGSFLGVTIATVIQFAFFYERYASCISNGYVIAILMLLFMFTLVTWSAHKVNIVRLFAGEEHKTPAKKLFKGAKSTEKV